MFTCKEFAKARSRKDDLPFFEKLALMWHQRMCPDCDSYARQLTAIEKTTREITELPPEIEAERRAALQKRILGDD